jgi:DTW domain-containing protein
MSATPDGKRATCARCLRPQRGCICRWITPVAPQAEVVILQHPLEIHQAKGSARLLHLSLARSLLVSGETFDEAHLQALLFAPLQANDVARQPLLLYPDTPDMPAVPGLPAMPTDPARTRLIVLDGTWRKSRKMLHLNPLLQRLPRLALHDAPASQYAIRKAHRPQQLSTLEAACHALAQLEHDDARYLPLLQAFDGFVAQQLTFAGR